MTSKSFALNGQRLTVLSNLHLDIKGGESLAIVGPSAGVCSVVGPGSGACSISVRHRSSRSQRSGLGTFSDSAASSWRTASQPGQPAAQRLGHPAQ